MVKGPFQYTRMVVSAPHNAPHKNASWRTAPLGAPRGALRRKSPSYTLLTCAKTWRTNLARPYPNPAPTPPRGARGGVEGGALRGARA